MDSGLTTLGAAIIGGLITLSTVWVTQHGAKEQQRREQRRAERVRLEDLELSWQRELIAQRRVCYTTYNAAARTTRDALKDCMHALKAGRPGLDSQLRDRLDEEWRTYVVRHAEAHMIVSDEVLELMGAVNGPLRAMYGIVQQVDQSRPTPPDLVEALDRRLRELWSPLEVMRSAMRRDLGVAALEEG